MSNTATLESLVTVPASPQNGHIDTNDVVNRIEEFSDYMRPLPGFIGVLTHALHSLVQDSDDVLYRCIHQKLGAVLHDFPAAVDYIRQEVLPKGHYNGSFVLPEEVARAAEAQLRPLRVPMLNLHRAVIDCVGRTNVDAVPLHAPFGIAGANLALPHKIVRVIENYTPVTEEGLIRWSRGQLGYWQHEWCKDPQNELSIRRMYEKRSPYQ